MTSEIDNILESYDGLIDLSLELKDKNLFLELTSKKQQFLESIEIYSNSCNKLLTDDQLDEYLHHKANYDQLKSLFLGILVRYQLNMQKILLIHLSDIMNKE